MNSEDSTLHPEDAYRSCASTIHIAAACDDAYAMPLAVMLRSLTDNLGPGHAVQAHILFETLSAAAKARLQASLPAERLQIRWVPVSNTGFAAATAPVRGYDHISLASYFRLLLPDVLPAELDRVIYLDCDLVVLGDIGRLWPLDLAEAYAAAVPELTADSRWVSSPQGLRLWRELGLAADLEQFNSGVLLINLAKWRAEFVKQRALIYLALAADWLRWHDQEALNAVFAGNWLRLDACWNLTMRHLMQITQHNRPSPCIIHYHTAAKPWHADYPFALQAEFFDYLDRTAWAGWRPVRPRLASPRRFGNRVVKALCKRQHTLRRLLSERARRIQGARLLAARPTLLRNPPPANGHSGEVRVFMVANACTPLARTLIDHYLQRGGARILVAIPAHTLDAWRSSADSDARVHLIATDQRSEDEILRVLLHHYGQGHWCLLARPDEWLRFPYDDRLTLTALTRFLDAQHCTALLARRVELRETRNPAAGEASTDGLTQCGEFRLSLEAVRKLPLTERDMIRHRVFVADSLVVPDPLDSASQCAYRSSVSLLRYAPDMLIGPGARSVHAARVSDIESVTLRSPVQGQMNDRWSPDAPWRMDWRELEAAGLLRATESLARIARAAPLPGE